MLDIGWQELFVIAVVALIVIGPKDLPRVLKAVMEWARKARTLAQEFRSGIDDLAREAEIDEVKKEIAKAADHDLVNQVKETLDPTGSIADDLGLKDVERTLETAAQGGVEPPAPPKPDVAVEPAPDATPPAPPTISAGEAAPAEAPAKAAG